MKSLEVLRERMRTGQAPQTLYAAAKRMGKPFDVR